MRWIARGAEPATLLAHRQTAGATFGNLPAATKVDLQRALLRSQGGLCAYCMRRIREDAMKIEHRVPQTSPSGQRRTLDWTNLLAVCLGEEGLEYSDQTCDTHKGSVEIDVDPSLKHHIDRLSYPAGELRSTSARHQQDITGPLNLNKSALTGARVAARDAILAAWDLTGRTWTKQTLTRKLTDLRGRTELPEFFGILESYVEKRLAR